VRQGTVDKCNDIIKREKRFVSLEAIPEEGYSDTGQPNVKFMMLIDSISLSWLHDGMAYMISTIGFDADTLIAIAKSM
jgi:hypothetical protein